MIQDTVDNLKSVVTPSIVIDITITDNFQLQIIETFIFNLNFSDTSMDLTPT